MLSHDKMCVINNYDCPSTFHGIR